MRQDETIKEAIDLLQDLGLQEYEARCFVALNQLPSGTAKEIHEISEVPRTRVYDAIRALESEGLVEVQHSSPQVYRAVEITEAIQTLQQKYNDRIKSLETSLKNTEIQHDEEKNDHVQEVWSLSGHGAIESRTLELIDEAESEIAFLVVDEEILSERLFDKLHKAAEQELSIVLGGQTEVITESLGTEFPNIRVFGTDLDWLTGDANDDEVAISRILLIDRETLLISSYYPGSGNNKENEQAIFARGLENGIIVLLRRLMTSGLSVRKDPGVSS